MYNRDWQINVVNVEVAKRLVKIGFTDPTNYIYTTNIINSRTGEYLDADEEWSMKVNGLEKFIERIPFGRLEYSSYFRNGEYGDTDYHISAPELEHVQEWLRDRYIDINIMLVNYEFSKRQYVYQIIDTLGNKVIASKEKFDSYEEALEEAINTAVTKLNF